MLLLHILIASGSIIAATFILLKPGRKLLVINYGLVAATFVSGTILVFMEPTHLLSACISGIVYAFIATAMTLGMRHKLHNRNRQAGHSIYEH